MLSGPQSLGRGLNFAKKRLTQVMVMLHAMRLAALFRSIFLYRSPCGYAERIILTNR